MEKRSALAAYARFMKQAEEEEQEEGDEGPSVGGHAGKGAIIGALAAGIPLSLLLGLGAGGITALGRGMGRGWRGPYKTTPKQRSLRNEHLKRYDEATNRSVNINTLGGGLIGGIGGGALGGGLGAGIGAGVGGIRHLMHDDEEE